MIAAWRDRREQIKTGFSDQIIVIDQSIPTGDFSIPHLQDEFAIERKTLPDALNCLGNDRKRFEDELFRSKSMRYFAIVIEAFESDVQKVFDADGCDSSGRKRFSKITPASVFGSLDTFGIRFNTHVHWVGNAAGASVKIERLLRLYYEEQASKRKKVIDAQNAAIEAHIKLVPSVPQAAFERLVGEAGAKIVDRPTPGSKFTTPGRVMDGGKR